MRALEEELGARLFDRTTHRVALTDAGVALLPEARRVLRAAEEALEAVAAVRGVLRGTLRVGIMQSLPAVDVASLLARFHEAHPEVELQLRPALGGSAALAEAVRQGTLDVAFASLPAGPKQGLSVTELALEPLVLIASPAAATGEGEVGEPVPLGDLAGERFVDFPAGWGLRAAADEAFAMAGVTRTPTIEVADVPTFVQLVQAGLGFGLLPASLVPGDGRLTARPVSPAPSWRVVLVMPSGRPPSSATRALLALLEKDRPGPAGADENA